MTRKPTGTRDKLPEAGNQEPPGSSAATDPGRDAKDRPGFDLGGAVTDATAGSGLGLGSDSAESRADRRLPRKKPTT